MHVAPLHVALAAAAAAGGRPKAAIKRKAVHVGQSTSFIQQYCLVSDIEVHELLRFMCHE